MPAPVPWLGATALRLPRKPDASQGGGSAPRQVRRLEGRADLERTPRLRFHSHCVLLRGGMAERGTLQPQRALDALPRAARGRSGRAWQPLRCALPCLSARPLITIAP